MIPFLIALLVLISAFLVMVVLLQRGRGGGLAGAFGSGGGTSSAFGTKTGDVFTIVTVVAFVLFMLVSIALTFQFKNRSKPMPVPAAPTDLVMTVTSPKSIQLSWKDNSKDETGFVIQRRTGTGDWVEVGKAAAKSTGYADTSVTGGTEYSYRVAATNASGSSVASNVITGTTPGAATGTTSAPVTQTQPAVERVGSVPAALPGTAAASAPAPAALPAAATTTAPRP